MEYILELIRYDFDNMENHNPESSKSLGVFCESVEKGKTAEGMLSDWLKKEKLSNVKIYMGWNGDIYPKFSVEKKYIR